MINVPALRTKFINMKKSEMHFIIDELNFNQSISFTFDVVQYGTSLLVIGPIQASMYLIGAVAAQGLETLYSSEII